MSWSTEERNAKIGQIVLAWAVKQVVVGPRPLPWTSAERLDRACLRVSEWSTEDLGPTDSQPGDWPSRRGIKR